MNKKLIAAAVSAAVIAPVAAQAESSFYASIRNAIDLSDLSGDGTTDISTVSSRFGFKGDTDIGNGMTAHGRYEFSIGTDKESAKSYVRKDGSTGTTGVDDVRIATVGLSGSFGRVDIGNQWSSYFNSFGTLVSPTFSLGYYLYSSVGQGPLRSSNTIKYSNTFGPLYAELDVRLNESNEGADVAEKIRGDGMGLGLSYSVTDNITIAAAFDNDDRDGDGTAATLGFAADDTGGDRVLAKPTFGGDASRDEQRMGIAVKATFGGLWAVLGWQNLETDDVTATISGTVDVNDDGTVDGDDDATYVGITVADGTIAEADVKTSGADIDTMFAWVGGSLGEKTNWNVGYANADDGVDNDDAAIRSGKLVSGIGDSEQLTWGIYHNIGGGLKLFYEGVSLESENKGWDGDRHLLGMRVDF